MASLSKPGISSSSIVSIPKDWSATWFANLVNNMLQGCDVRNAIGANGIVITGNITTPYATISLGGTDPIVLTNNITLNPTSGVALTIHQAGGTDGIEVFATAGNGATIVAAGNGVTAANGAQLQYSAGGNLNLNLGGAIRMRLAAGGASIFGFGPNAAALVDMTPDSGSYVGAFNGLSGTPTATLFWQRNGNQVTIFVPITTANSTATTLTITVSSGTAPPNPTRAQRLQIPDACAEDAGAIISASASGAAGISVAAGSSLLTLYKNGNASGWTNTATLKGVAVAFSFTYLLN